MVDIFNINISGEAKMPEIKESHPTFSLSEPYYGARAGAGEIYNDGDIKEVLEYYQLGDKDILERIKEIWKD